MKAILFPFIYLFELIRINIIKTILITITSIFFAYAGTYRIRHTKELFSKKYK